MSSVQLPSADSDYVAYSTNQLTAAFWNAALVDVGTRLRELEAQRTDLQAVIDAGTTQALEMVAENVAPQLDAVQATINSLNTQLASAQDAIALIVSGGIEADNVNETATRVFITPAQKASLNQVVSDYATLTAGANSLYDTLAEIGTAITAANASIATKLPLSGGTLSGALNKAPRGSIASASTVAIGAATTNYIQITGTTAITAFDTIASGAERIVEFAGALTLTHNATSLILPGAANITTAAGDTAKFVSEGSGNWRCLWYQRASGLALASSAAYKQIATHTFATETTVPFTGLSVNDLALYFNNVVASTTTSVKIDISTDNGATWLSGSTAIGSFATSAKYHSAFLTGLSKGIGGTILPTLGPSVPPFITSGASVSFGDFWNTGGLPINAIRLITNGSPTLNSGSVTLYGA